MKMTEEERKAKRKAYEDANKEKIAARNKALREKNKEKLKAQKRAWHEANKEKQNAKSRAYWRANKEKMRIRVRAWRNENKEKMKAKRRAWVGANKEKYLLRLSRKRARTECMDCDITLEDIIIPEFCPVLGIKLDRSAPPRADNLPSLDRVDSTRGYVKGNTRVISWRANYLKRHLSLGEVAALYEYMLDHMCGNKP